MAGLEVADETEVHICRLQVVDQTERASVGDVVGAADHHEVVVAVFLESFYSRGIVASHGA